MLHGMRMLKANTLFVGAGGGSCKLQACNLDFFPKWPGFPQLNENFKG